MQIVGLLVGWDELTSYGSADPPAATGLLRFRADHGVVTEVEVLLATRVQEALDRLAAGDVHNVLVLDTSALV